MSNLIINNKKYPLTNTVEESIYNLGYKKVDIKKINLPDDLVNIIINIDVIKKDYSITTFIQYDGTGEFIGIEEIYRNDNKFIYYHKELDKFCGVTI